MTTPNCRATLAKAADYLARLSEKLATPDDLNEADQLECEIRALLAAPEAVGVGDEDWKGLEMDLWDQHKSINSDDEEVMYDHGFHFAMDDLRSRYGAAHPASVPVDERPWERDGWGDAKGMCWLSEKGTLCDPPAWAFVHKARLIDAASYPSGAESLPHWALPLPGVE